jgi:uncharacterized protein (TIRG00374 family)
LSAKKESLSRSQVLASVIIERIADLIIACLLLGAVTFIIPMPVWLKDGGLIIGVIAIVAFLFLLVIESFGSPLIKKLLKLINFFPKWVVIRINLLVDNFLEGIQGLLNIRAAILFLLLTLFIWCIDISIIWFLAKAFYLDLSFPHSVIAQLFATFSGLIPALPGQIGAFEFAIISGLKAVGIESDAALVFAFGWHIYYLVITSILGIISLSFNDLSVFSSRIKDFK